MPNTGPITVVGMDGLWLGGHPLPEGYQVGGRLGETPEHTDGTVSAFEGTKEPLGSVQNPPPVQPRNSGGLDVPSGNDGWSVQNWATVHGAPCARVPGRNRVASR